MSRRALAGSAALLGFTLLTFPLASAGCNLLSNKEGDSSSAAQTTAAPRPVLTFTMPGGATSASATSTAPAASTAPKQPCLPCATQEDFDAAQKKGRTCCAAQNCIADSGCTGGRVCCKIPGGTLCTDAGRCGAGDRVKGPTKTPHGACRTPSDCPDGDICCDTGAGAGKPGKCMGVSDGIKGCAPPP